MTELLRITSDQTECGCTPQGGAPNLRPNHGKVRGCIARNMATSPIGLFGGEWLRSPRSVGAIAPSSGYLAHAITKGLSKTDGPVLELGPGTGVFTRALMERGVLPEQIAAIEASEGFAITLAGQLSRVTVIHGDAASISQLTPFGPSGAALIICGLPLLSMPPAKVLRILSGCMRSLRQDGEVRLFTYGPRCPVSKVIRVRLGLVARRVAFVPMNIPPASVFSLRPKVNRL